MTDVMTDPSADVSADDTDDAGTSSAPVPKPPKTEDEKKAEFADWYASTFPAEVREAHAKTKFTGEFRFVRAGDIKVPDHQRRKNVTKAKKIVEHWDPLAFEPIVVSERADGSLWSPEGQHRAWVTATMNPDMMIPCWVHKDLTTRDEAHQTGTIHRGRTSFSPTDLYRTDLAAGEAEAVAVDRVVTAAGLAVGKNGLTAVKALRRMYETIGEDGLATVLRVINNSWIVAYPDQAWGYTTLAAVGDFIRLYTDVEGEAIYDEQHLVQTLRQWAPKALEDPIRNSKEHYTSKPKAVADLLATYYNRGVVSGSGVKRLQIRKKK